MTGRLLKYELKATVRVMLPLYLVTILASLLMAANLGTGTEKNIIINTIINAVFFIAIFVVIVMGLLLILQRFYKNLLGSEGYLMFTLPVTTWQNILGKALAALIWILCSIGVGALCGLIFICLTGSISSFSHEFRLIWGIIRDEGNPWLYVFFLIVLIAAGALEKVMKIYAAISAGHQWSSHRILGSILAYAGFAAMEVILSYGLKLRHWISYFAGLNNEIPSLSVIVFLLCVTAAGIVIYGFITWYLLDKHLNLE